MQNRLITFGCSLTYGHGLPDCLDENNHPSNCPSKFSWPQLVANHLNLECINNSACGSSNKKIWNSILNFNFKITDTVIVMWSHPLRNAILKQDSIIDIGPWLIENSKVAENYYSHIYDEFGSKLETALYINHSNFFLKSIGISPHHLIISESENTCFRFKNLRTKHIPLFILNPKYMDDIDEFRFKSHPGLKGHETFYKDLIKFL
jgi:hypothetical protein